MEHTKGKWIEEKRRDGFGDYDIFGKNDGVNNVWLARCFGKKSKANAERICLCVNAHDALLKEQGELKAALVKFEQLASEEYAGIKAINGNLLVACEALVSGINNPNPDGVDEVSMAEDKAKAAIAKAREI